MTIGTRLFEVRPNTLLASVEKVKSPAAAALEILHQRYLYDILVGELGVSKSFTPAQAAAENPPGDPTFVTAVVNLRKAAKFVQDDTKCMFNAILARSVHEIVGGDGLIANAGQFRTYNVSAAGSSVAYAPHMLIKRWLISLMIFIRRTFEAVKNLSEKMAGAALFYSEFLLVRPFCDGNGRTARLLLSKLLAGTVPVPVTPTGGRDIYLAVLEVRNDGFAPPVLLAGYILKSIVDRTS